MGIIKGGKMELIKLLDVANPKLIKDTLNKVSQDYETFRTEIEETANAALNTAVTANNTANTALTTVTDYEAIVMESAQDSAAARQTAEEALATVTQADERSQEAALLAEQAFTEASEAVQTSELAMNVANEAKSTVDQALDIGSLGSFVHNVNGIALAHAHMTDDPNQADDEDLSFLATPTLVREAVKGKADLTNKHQEITAHTITSSNLNVKNLYVADGYVHGRASDDGIYSFQFMSPTGTDYRTAHFSSDKFRCNEIGFTRLNNISKKVLLDFIHPVNSIIEIEDDTFDPNDYYAGTDSVWERLPDGYVLWSASRGAGQTIPAGLPNITGSFDTLGKWYNASLAIDGAFYESGASTSIGLEGGSGNDMRKIRFDANRSNSIYGSSSTVQPPARKMCMWKRTA